MRPLNRRLAGIAAVGVVGAAIAVVLVMRGERPVVPGLDISADASPEAEPAVPMRASAASRSPSAPLVEEESPEEGADRDEGALATADVDSIVGPVDGLLVEGTIVAVDGDGSERRDASGSFEPVFWNGGSGSDEESVRVEQGAFRVRVPAGLELGIDSLVLEGRPADPTPQKILIQAAGRIELHARWEQRVRLHVVDSISKLDLPEVKVVAIDGSGREQWIHPGDLVQGMLLSEFAPSPFDLHVAHHYGDLNWEQRLFAVAPGHAWASAVVDFRLGGDVTLELVPGGELEVTIVGEMPPLPRRAARLRRQEPGAAILRFRHPSEAEEGSPISELSLAAGGPMRIEGLPAGRVAIALERGHWFATPQRLASAVADVVPGIRVPVTLTIAPAHELSRVPLSGTVHFSTSWESTFLDLRFEPIDVPGATAVDRFELEFSDLVAIAGEPGEYRFDAGTVLPGRYLVKSYAREFQQVVETGPGGTDAARIVIGDPANVTVRLVDEETGRPVRGGELRWNCKRPDGIRGASLDSADWNAAEQVWTFRAPSGEIELCFWDVEFEPFDDRAYRVEPGRNERTIRVKRATGIELTLVLHGVVVGWPEAVWSDCTVTILDDPPREAEQSWSSDRSLGFRVQGPGRVRIDVPLLPGYLPVASFELTLERGVMTKHAIELRRAR